MRKQKNKFFCVKNSTRTCELLIVVVARVYNVHINKPGRAISENIQMKNQLTYINAAEPHNYK